MARQGINTGTSPNSGTGDTLLEGGVKINDNFIELYDLCGNGNVLAPGIVTSILAGDGISVDQTTGQVTVTASVASTENVAAEGLFVTGISTLGSNNGIGTVTIGVGNTALFVDGNARVIGVLTVGRDSIRIDGESNEIHVGQGVTLMATGEAEYSGVVTANSGFVGPSAVYSGITTINEEGLQVTGITTLSGNVTLGVTTAQAVTVNSAIKGNLNPSSNQTFNLGTVGFKWNNLFANFGTLTQVVLGNNQGITTISEEGLNVTGITTLSGNVTLGVTTANATTVNSVIKGNLNPSQNQAFNLGTIGFKWNNLFANVARLTTAQIGNKIFLNDVSDAGVITATSFVGDGSQLTGVTAVGSGVEIEDGGSVVGVAGTINFGNNLSVSPVSLGIVTVTASGGGGGGSTVWETNSTGINTSTNVGIGTTTCTAPLTVRCDAGDVDSGISLESVTGTQIVEIGQTGVNGGGHLELKRSGSVSEAQLNVGANNETASNRGVILWAGNTSNDFGRISILANTNTDTNSVFRVVSANNDASSKSTKLLFNTDGSAEFARAGSATTITQDGIVSGGATFGGNVQVGVNTHQTLDLNSFIDGNLIPKTNQSFNIGNNNNKWNNLVANNATLSVLSLGSGIKINGGNTGVITATKFSGDGSELTGITAAGSGVEVEDNGTTVGTAGTINFGANLSVTPISLGIVTVTGSAGGGSTDNIITGTAATFTGGIEVSGITTINSGGVDVTGVVTATSFVGSLTGSATAAVTAVSIPISNITANADRVLVVGGTTPLASGVAAGLVANNNLAYNPSTAHLKVGTGFSVFGSTGVVTATAFVGDGSGLTNLPSSSGYTTSRFVASGTQNSLAVGATTNLDIAGFDSYALLKVGISSAAWVRLYTDPESRTNDNTRTFDQDPAPGSGVIAEVRTTTAGVSTFRISPGVIGYNDATSIGSTIFTAVVNNEDSVTNLTVDLTIINLEP